MKKLLNYLLILCSILIIPLGAYAASSPTYNTATKLLTKVTTLMEYSVDGGTTWTRCSGNKVYLSAETITAENDIKVRVAASGNTPAGNIQTIDILAGPSAPSATYSTVTKQLENVTKLMEYSINGGTTWVKCKPTKVNLSKAVITAANDIKIRVAAAGLTLVGDTQTLDILAGPAAPLATYSMATKHLENVTTLMEYSIDGGKKWTTCVGTTVDLSTAKVTVDKDIKVRIAAAGLTLVGDVQTLNLVAGPAAPSAMYSTVTKWLQNVTTAMEYSINGGTTWIACGGTTVDLSESEVTDKKDVKVRIAADGLVLVGNIQTINVLAGPGAPSATYSTVTEQLGKVKTTMEYSIDGGTTWIECSGTTVDLSNASITAENDIKVRAAAVGCTLAGKVKKIDILAEPAAPSATFSMATKILSNVTKLMEYSIDGGTTWIACGGKIVNLSSATLTGENDIKVRVAAIKCTLAGNIQTIDIAAPSAPSAVFDTISKQLMDVTSAMEYSIDGGTTWIACGGTAVDLSAVTITIENGIKVRIAATVNTLAGDIQTIEFYGYYNAGVISRELIESGDDYSIKIIGQDGLVMTYSIKNGKVNVMTNNGNLNSAANYDQIELDTIFEQGLDTGEMVVFKVEEDNSIKAENFYLLKGYSIYSGNGFMVTNVQEDIESVDNALMAIQADSEMYVAQDSTTYINIDTDNIEKITGWASIVSSNQELLSSADGLYLVHNDDNLISSIFITVEDADVDGIADYLDLEDIYGMFVESWYDADDERVSVLVNGVSKEYTVADSVYDELEEGDLIQFNVNGDGEAKVAEADNVQLFDQSAIKDLVDEDNADAYKIKYWNSADKEITFDEDLVGRDTRVILAQDAYVYDCRGGEAEVGAFSDLAGNQYIVVADLNDDEEYEVVAIMAE